MNKDDRIRWIRAHLINSEFFPKMMSDMIIAPQNVVYTLIMNTPSFLKKLSVKEQQIVKTIDKEGFQKLDTSLMYKCIRHFHLVGEPTDQWGAPVLQTSSTQGDDVERLHKLRNNISHLPKPILSESEFTEFMSTCFEVALRRDSSLKSPGNRFLAEIREYGTLQIMDSNLEKKYVSLLEENNFLKEQAQQMVGNRKVTIFYGQDVEDKIAGDTSKELSCIVYIYGAHLSDEGMKKTGEFFKNLNESILNVRVQRIGTGSIILYVIIYKEAMKDKTCLHNSLCIIMEKMFPFFHDFGRCEKTIQIALYAAQGFFADNASDSLSYLSDESAAVSFDCKLPRDKIAMNNVLFEYAGNVFMNKTNETETKSASELNVVVTPKNKGIWNTLMSFDFRRRLFTIVGNIWTTMTSRVFAAFRPAKPKN